MDAGNPGSNPGGVEKKLAQWLHVGAPSRLVDNQRENMLRCEQWPLAALRDNMRITWAFIKKRKKSFNCNSVIPTKKITWESKEQKSRPTGNRTRVTWDEYATYFNDCTHSLLLKCQHPRSDFVNVLSRALVPDISVSNPGLVRILFVSKNGFHIDMDFSFLTLI